MSNASELLINTVTESMPKRLIGMNQKVVSWLFLWDSEIRHHKAPGEKALTGRVTGKERGKPILLTFGQVSRKVSCWPCG